MSAARESSLEQRPWVSLYPDGAISGAPTHGTVLGHFCAQVTSRPDAVALRYFGESTSFRRLDELSDALASWLRERGVAPGDRVSLLYQNAPEFVAVLLAAWKIGAIPTPSNPAYRRGELAGVFADARPAAVFCEVGCLAEVSAALESADLSSIPLVVSRPHSGAPGVTDTEAEFSPGALRFEDLVAEYAGRSGSASQADGDIGALLYTSGTTGLPKGALLRNSSLAFNAEALARWCGLDEDSRILAIAPFFHITGLVCHIAAAFASGAELVLHYRFDAALVLDVIRETRPTFTIGAITAFNALMNAPGAEADDLASFKTIYSGGAPIPPALVDAFRQKFGIPIHTSFGMTETSAPTHMAPLGAAIPVDPYSGALAIGVPMPSTDAICVDDEGRPLPPGEAGELLLRGPQIMAGYFNKPVETAASLTDGWMRSGDIAFRDDAGWFYLVDRKKDVIIASGFKVWPREVEDVLYAHPAVREAAVIGVPDAYRGETVKACVSLRAGASVDSQTLIAHCRERLAAYKAPRLVEILDDLPKTVTGKIQRVVLRASARESS